MRVIIAFTCLSLLGIFLIPTLPVKLNPSRRLPVVNVSFSMPGQSAQVVEAEVTSRLEGMLGRMKGVKQLNSHSGNGSGSITARLSERVDPDLARFEVSTIVRQAWPTLPRGVSYPSIYMSGTTDEIHRPFLTYTVNAPDSPARIQALILDALRPKIAGIKGVDKVEVAGAGRMIYRLEYDHEQLQKLGVSARELRSAIQAHLAGEFLGVGKVLDENQDERLIRVALLPALHDREEFDPALVQVKNREGTILYLNQLARTTREEEEVSSSFRVNGLNSIYLSIHADETTNQLALGKEVRELIDGRGDILPPGYELHLQYDATEYLRAEMDKIYFRSGLTVLLLLCFVFAVYRDPRYSLLVLFSLVANVAVAAIFYRLLRLEMQLFSLAGLTISLTLIIDNTIIMSDQLLKRHDKKAFLAILAATMTSIGALTIILFMNETVRNNLQDFARVIIINLTVSLFVALFLVPALVEKFGIERRRKRQRKEKKSRECLPERGARRSALRGKRKIVYFNRGYERVILFMQRRKRWFVVLIILAFGLPVYLLPDSAGEKPLSRILVVANDKKPDYWANLYNKTLGSAFYKEHVKPISDVALGGTARLFAQKVKNGSYSSGERSETMIQVTASLPNGSTREQMDNLIRGMESYIRQYPEVRQFETRVESGQRASIQIMFTREHQRGSFPYMLKNRLISKALELGSGSWGVYGIGDGFNNTIHESAGDSRVKLLGYNYDELTSMAIALKDSLLQHRRIKEVTIDSKFSWYKNDYAEFVLDLQRERLARYDIRPVELFYSIAPLFEKSSHAGNWTRDGRTEPIQLFARQASELDVWNLENYPGQSGERHYKIAGIAGIDQWIAPQAIAKENQQYLLCLQYEYIGAHMQGYRVNEQAIEAFNRSAPLGYRAESGHTPYWWGSSNNFSQYLLLSLVVVIIFFMTSFLFNSLGQPLVVVFIIPVSFIGLFLTFYWFQLNFDQGGFAAFILLAALSVNANIYILNEYNNIRKARPSIRPLRAYLKAWNMKISPIFLTIASSILGFIPFIAGAHREAFWFPLAAGSIGGLIFSLLALFIYLPLFMGVGKTRINTASTSREIVI